MKTLVAIVALVAINPQGIPFGRNFSTSLSLVNSKSGYIACASRVKMRNGRYIYTYTMHTRKTQGTVKSQWGAIDCVTSGGWMMGMLWEVGNKDTVITHTSDSPPVFSRYTFTVWQKEFPTMRKYITKNFQSDIKGDFLHYARCSAYAVVPYRLYKKSLNRK